MFTLRHIEDNQHESIRQAKWVSYDPGHGNSSSGERCLHYGNAQMDVDREPTVDEGRFASGTVYVMNENGKTVAKYDFGDWRTDVASRKRGGVAA